MKLNFVFLFLGIFFIARSLLLPFSSSSEGEGNSGESLRDSLLFLKNQISDGWKNIKKKGNAHTQPLFYFWEEETMNPNESVHPLWK